jgi:hypothetical protein
LTVRDISYIPHFGVKKRDIEGPRGQVFILDILFGMRGATGSPIIIDRFWHSVKNEDLTLMVFKVIDDNELKKLDKSWKKYRKNFNLDAYGKIS